ncbi:DUF1570 domain-containing protein [Pirellulales bacterium]|nr:DUF1570 domain-containing protein [Pirellulales bacterium]
MPTRVPCFTAALLIATLAGPASALESVTAVEDGQQTELHGEVLVEGSGGGVLLKTADGAIHRLPPDSIVERTRDEGPLVMLDKDALAEQLRAELSTDFQIYQSKRYVVCFNTTRTYAKWCSSLLERLHDAFVTYWKKRGADVKPPDHPLIVLVFADQASYARHAKAELGKAVGSVIGYYSFTTNRIVMYDLTGMQALKRDGGRRGSLHDITEMLSDPAAEPLVATIVHEATHQISYNCGLQTREVDNPLWLSEGMAEFFETPDLSSGRSWRGVGKVNYSRWNRFKDNYNANRVFDLETMIADDELFRNPETAVDGYAQTWAWNYFLIRSRPKEYVAYLRDIAAKPLLARDTPADRVADFKRHFGDDFNALEADFFRHMSRID